MAPGKMGHPQAIDGPFHIGRQDGDAARQQQQRYGDPQQLTQLDRSVTPSGKRRKKNKKKNWNNFSFNVEGRDSGQQSDPFVRRGRDEHYSMREPYDFGNIGGAAASQPSN